VFHQLKPPPLRYFLLPSLNGGIKELFYSPTSQAHEVIVVLALIELKYGLA
jgi:hypothetical protein